MCDQGSLNLQNNLQSPPRRELQIVLERAECIFPALKDDLVSVFVFVHTEKEVVNVFFHNNYFWKPFFDYINISYLFSLICF
jgi:hypothetical protein